MNGWQKGRFNGKENLTLSDGKVIKIGDVIWAVGPDPLSTTKRKMECFVEDKSAYWYISIPIENFHPILTDNKM